jgi:hypothetical protein
MSSEEPVRNAHAIVRLIVGLAGGLALYLLYSAFDAKLWPATDGRLFAPLVFVALCAPLIVIQGTGNIRPRTLIVWTAAAAVIVAGLAWYDIWRAWPWEWTWVNSKQVMTPGILPSFAVFFFTAAGIFIAHALVSGGDHDRRFMATYPTHFDVAWKLGLQLVLSAVFVGLFWALLWLGASLFSLIKLDFLQKLIEHRWFAIPATALATAAALHVTDVQAGLVRGARTLVLVLLSWLLPVMTLLAGGFLASLTFTGLAPLWGTRHASGLLLTAAAALIVLINAAYQDGDAERRAPAVLRYASRAASVILVPLAALAAYALFLRVEQYGWTVDRVATAACVVLAVSYAVGYALAAFNFRDRLIETWNFATSLLVLAVLFALFTPIADPARISVADQIARLQSGKIKSEKFDFAFLRWEGERFGFNALNTLMAQTKNTYTRLQIASVLKSTNRYFTQIVPTPQSLAAHINVYPAGRKLPQSFLNTNWSADPSAIDNLTCLQSMNDKCDAVLADMDGDGKDEIILLESNDARIYRDEGGGVWRIAGQFSLPCNCHDRFQKALLAGHFKPVAPVVRLNDVEIDGRRFEVSRPPVFASAPDGPK